MGSFQVLRCGCTDTISSHGRNKVYCTVPRLCLFLPCHICFCITFSPPIAQKCSFSSIIRSTNIFPLNLFFFYFICEGNDQNILKLKTYSVISSNFMSIVFNNNGVNVTYHIFPSFVILSSFVP